MGWVLVCAMLATNRVLPCWSSIHYITWFWAWLWKFYSASGDVRDFRLAAYWLCIASMSASCALSLVSGFGGMSGPSSMALKGWYFFKGSLWWILSSLGTCWERGTVWWHAALARWRRWTNQADSWTEKTGGHFYTWPRFWWHLFSSPLVWLMLLKALPQPVYAVYEPCLAQPRPLEDHLARLSAFEVPPVPCTAENASQASTTCLHVPYSYLPSRRFPSVRPRLVPRLPPEATSGGSPPMYSLNGPTPCPRHSSTCTAWPGTWPLTSAGCYRKGSLSLRHACLTVAPVSSVPAVGGSPPSLVTCNWYSPCLSCPSALSYSGSDGLQPTGPEPIVLAPSYCLFLSLKVPGTSSCCLPGSPVAVSVFMEVPLRIHQLHQPLCPILLRSADWIIARCGASHSLQDRKSLLSSAVQSCSRSLCAYPVHC